MIKIRHINKTAIELLSNNRLAPLKKRHKSHLSKLIVLDVELHMHLIPELDLDTNEMQRLKRAQGKNKEHEVKRALLSQCSTNNHDQSTNFSSLYREITATYSRSFF